MNRRGPICNPNWTFLVLSVFMAAALVISTLNYSYLVKLHGPLVPTDPASTTTKTTSTNVTPANYVQTGLSSTTWNHLHHSINGNPRVLEANQVFNSTNAKNMQLSWKSDISSIPGRQPTTDGVSLYGCDTRGYLYKTNLIDGREDWKRSMEVITGVTGAKCGSTPLVHINGLFVGDKRSGTLYKIDKTNGELLWKVTLDAHAYASITQTPSEYKGVIYVGVNTLEPHILRTEPNYPCCSFRGSVAAIASSSGKVYWRTQLLPDDDRKLSGLAVVNDSPVIDANEGVIYVTTGPVYSASQQTLANCFGATRDASSCGLDQTNVAGNAIVSLNMITGAIKWSVRNTALKPSNYTSLASLYDNKRTMEFLQFVGPQTLLAYDNEGNVLVFDRYKTKLNYVSDVCTQGRLSKEFVSIKKDKGSRIDVKFICDKNSFLQLGTLVLNITITDKKTNDHRLAFKEYQSTTLPIRAMAKSHMISVNDLIVHSAKIDTKSSHVTVNEETSGNTLFSGVIEGDTKGCIYIENKLICTTDDEIYCYKMK